MLGLFLMSMNNAILLDGVFSLSRVLIALGIGLIVAFIAKSTMSNVAPKVEASEYIRENSMNLTERTEEFLYSNTTRIKIRDDD